MKKSEFKEYLKTEILKMTEATADDVQNQKEYNAELEKTKELEKSMKENIISIKEFKKFIREEILQGIAEQEEEDNEEGGLEDVGGEEEIDANEFNFDEPGFESTGTEDIDEITDGLVELARKAKDMNQIELANQILNSAKFSAKTQFKDVEKEA